MICEKLALDSKYLGDLHSVTSGSSIGTHCTDSILGVCEWLVSLRETRVLQCGLVVSDFRLQ